MGLYFIKTFLLSCFTFSSVMASTTYTQENIELLKNYTSKNRELWLNEDYNLFQEVINNSPKWKVRQNKVDKKTNLNLFIMERKDPNGDSNHLFYYYNQIELNAPLETIAAMFSKRIDLSGNWTKELKSYKQIAKIDNGDGIWLQQFDPGISFISGRDLLAAYAQKVVDENTILLSMRSVHTAIPHFKPEGNHKMIGWHGAFLLTRCGDKENETTCVEKLDRENQGGMFPSCLMNKIMPKFLDEEVIKAINFVDKTPNEELN